jgi:hypothetical protein
MILARRFDERDRLRERAAIAGQECCGAGFQLVGRDRPALCLISGVGVSPAPPQSDVPALHPSRERCSAA